MSGDGFGEHASGLVIKRVVQQPCRSWRNQGQGVQFGLLRSIEQAEVVSDEVAKVAHIASHGFRHGR